MIFPGNSRQVNFKLSQTARYPQEKLPLRNNVTKGSIRHESDLWKKFENDDGWE